MPSFTMNTSNASTGKYVYAFANKMPLKVLFPLFVIFCCNLSKIVFQASFAQMELNYIRWLLLLGAHLEPCQLYIIKRFCKNRWRLQEAKYFREKASSKMFYIVLNTAMFTISCILH